MNEMSSTVELGKVRQGMRAYGSDDRPIGTVEGLAQTGFRVGGVEYAGEAVARVAGDRVYLHLTSEQARELRGPVPVEPRREREQVPDAPGSDYERRYGRNWSETDTGGTSGMGTSRTSGDRGPRGATESTGRTGGARGSDSSRPGDARAPIGADRDEWQRLRDGVREGREGAPGE